MHSRINKLTIGTAGTIYRNLISNEKFTYSHQFIKCTYDKYLAASKSNPSINGLVFEYLICETLAQQNIVPFYYQARFELFPNASFDIVLYHPQNPVVLTMKVSLRERYKQADLEGWALRQVYHGADNYLVTLSEKEAESVKDKIKNGLTVGLTGVVLASSTEYDRFLDAILAQRQFCVAEQIYPLQQGTLVPNQP